MESNKFYFIEDKNRCVSSCSHKLFPTKKTIFYKSSTLLVFIKYIKNFIKENYINFIDIKAIGNIAKLIRRKLIFLVSKKRNWRI